MDFRDGFTKEKLDRLVWGITGVKPGKSDNSTTRNTQAARNSTPGIHNAAEKLWHEKLEFLQEQEAISSDPSQLITLKKLIERAQQKIQHYISNP